MNIYQEAPKAVQTQGQAQVRQGQVATQLELMDKFLSGLHTSISSLNERVHATLRQVPPSGKETDVFPLYCPLAAELRAMNTKIYHAISRIQDLCERCEL